MEDELKDLREITNNIDVNKVIGKYILFGNFINDCTKNAEIAFKELYYDFYTLHESFLAQFAEKQEFESVKKLLLGLVDFLKKEIEQITSESLTTLWHQAIEHAKENKNDIIKHFCSKKEDYFV